jgi:hypothetical protein
MSTINKICTSCKKKLNKKNFRKIKRSNWIGFYPQCKICESSLMKVKYSQNPIPQMLSNAKIRAKQKNVYFNLTFEYLKKIFPQNNKCPVIGVNFQFGYKNLDKKNTDFAPSLDRIVPEKGYVEGNVIVVCNIVNRVKSDSTIKILEKVFKFYKKLENTNK